MDIAGPWALGQIARHAHQRSKANAATDQDDALFLLARESKGPIRGENREGLSRPDRIMQPP
jgi:hypothetical protein